MKSSEITRVIKDDGWYSVGAKGSHHHFKHLPKKGKVTVPHPKELPVGTVKSILRQAGL